MVTVPPSILFFGDSITQGRGVEAPERFTDLLQARLGERFGGAPAVRVVNRGVEGDTARLALLRFGRHVLAEPPDVLVIQFGLNDAYCFEDHRGWPRTPVGIFALCLAEMVERAAATGIGHVALMTAHPVIRTAGRRDAGTGAQQHPYDEAVRERARASSALLIDIAAAFAAAPAGDAHVQPLPDGLHLSAAGHRRYADLVEAGLRPALDARVPASAAPPACAS